VTQEEIEKKAYEVYPERKMFIPQDPYPPMEIDTNAHRREGYIKALTEIESLPKIHGWVARDDDGELGLFPAEPARDLGMWGFYPKFVLEPTVFPEVTWKSEPIKVELLIR